MTMKTIPILAPHIVSQITGRLTAAIGIDPGALDPARLMWIVGARCRLLNLPDAAAYAAFLADRPEELTTLIDEVVVQETRFFRDPAVFDHIRRAIAQMATVFDGPLRILSAPCGTGQEAYSLAAMLAVAGVPPTRFSIDAFDISLSALAIALCGVYPEHALRHVSPELQQACGSRQGSGQNKHWLVHETLRTRIQFTRRNLAEPDALGSEAQYHLILCRNLFIYLSPPARTALAQSLAAALVPGGRLVIGTADRVEELNALFSPLRPASSFAFVHRERALPAVAPARRHFSGIRRAQPVMALPTAAPIPPAAPAPAGPMPTTAAELLKHALEHQQRGDVVKAERRCRQALYLAPNLLPALELLQTLWSQHPNLRQRRALRDRILRSRLALPDPAAWKETA